MELTPVEEEEFIQQWERQVFQKNDDFDTEEGFTRTLDRMFAHIPKQEVMDREYEISTKDLEDALTSMNPFKAPGPDGMKLGMVYVGGD